MSATHIWRPETELRNHVTPLPKDKSNEMQLPNNKTPILAAWNIQHPIIFELYYFGLTIRHSHNYSHLMNQHYINTTCFTATAGTDKYRTHTTWTLP